MRHRRIAALAVAVLTLAGTALTGTAASAAPAKGSISGHIYADLNANGKLDPGKPGVRNRTVLLFKGTHITGREAYKTTTTSTTGWYSFKGLPKGTYTVTFVVGTALLGKTTSVDKITHGPGKRTVKVTAAHPKVSGPTLYMRPHKALVTFKFIDGVDNVRTGGAVYWNTFQYGKRVDGYGARYSVAYVHRALISAGKNTSAAYCYRPGDMVAIVDKNFTINPGVESRTLTYTCKKYKYYPQPVGD